MIRQPKVPISWRKQFRFQGIREEIPAVRCRQLCNDQCRFSEFPLRCSIGPTANPGTQVDGAGEGTRTPDLVITNDPLYLLSYTGATSVISDVDAPKKLDLRCSENSFCRIASWNSCGLIALTVNCRLLNSDIAGFATVYLVSNRNLSTH